MRKLLIILLLQSLLLSQAAAQSRFPQPFEINTDTLLIDTLPNASWQVLEDKDGGLNVAQILNAPYNNLFHDDPGEINFHIPVYWFRFALKNTTGHELKIGFYEHLKSVSDWYFIKEDGAVIHHQSGLEIPWSKNESLKFVTYFTSSLNFMPLVLQPGETIAVYNRTAYNYFNYSNTDPHRFYITYGSTEKVLLKNYVENDAHYFNSVSNAFFFGLMFVTALFSIFSFITIREKVYLYFGLYVFFLGFGRFLIESEFYLEFLKEHPLIFSNILLHFFWFLPLLFLTRFISLLLDVKRYYPRWNSFLFYLSAFYAGIAFSADCFDYLLRGTDYWGIVNSAAIKLSLVLMSCVLITLFLFLKQHLFSYNRFLISIIPAFFTWTVGFGLFNYVDHSPGFQQWVNNNWHTTENICLIWQVVCFSWLLFHQFVVLKNEVTKKEMEKQVERSELLAQKSEIEMQALRAQMNPHFIFNSLNSINRFILQNNKAEASEYLTKFSKLVRLILQNSQFSMISLDSEIESLSLYLELEALRFNYYFAYKINIASDIDLESLKVPPLIIQPYVENAIWHGLMHKEEKGELTIDILSADAGIIFRITDNGIGRQKAAELASKSATRHKSMGLRLTAQRISMLQQMAGEESPVSVVDLTYPDGSAAGTEVTIIIPEIYD
ncbi:MAG TPA: histidine kinase [Panacibacter sp.]|nr:histidine kinase [Panacibacter sp.]HNP45252.1 histidine kinase [Panacibacter sp.]